MSLNRQKFGVVGTLATLMAIGCPAVADQNKLFVEQIGDRNRAIVYQSRVPTADDVGNVLGTTTSTPFFDLFHQGAFSNLSVGTSVGVTSLTPVETSQSIGDLLDNFQGLSGGRNNVAKVRQDGFRNKALSVQVDGSNNRLLTEQTGNDNVGVHLQRGSSNNTELVQIGDGNENALIAEGNAVGSDGPLRLQAQDGVKGFSIRADGPQATFSTVTVEPNHTNGLNITLQ
jgi:hypothetical protein